MVEVWWRRARVDGGEVGTVDGGEVGTVEGR